MWFNKIKPFGLFAGCVILLIAVACSNTDKPLTAELLAKFQPGFLPFEVTEETFYEYGEWEWLDSSVVNRPFPELSNDELRSLGDQLPPVPEGILRRTAALKILGSVDGRRVLLYRHDIRPVDDVPSAPEGSLQFIAVLVDEHNKVLDRQILADWKGRSTLKLGSIDEHFAIRTITRPYDSDQPDTLRQEEKFKMTAKGWSLIQ